MLSLLVTIVLAIAGVLFFGFGGKDTALVSTEVISPITRKEKLDFSVFDHSFFEKAREDEVMELEVGETGRENPFLPF